MKTLARRYLLAPLIVAAAMAVNGAAAAATGAERFAHDCAACHGASARGDGAQGLKLDPRPANLRTLAARNGGHFPADKVRRIIDGRDQGRAHGDGKMPVWGHEYSRALAGQGERMVQENLDNLVEFLETIQE
jgi:mono/diheme cytochrome c family protein